MVLPCLMGVFNSIGGSCLGWIGEGIKTETTLLFSYADNIVNLRKQLQDLTDAIKSLEDRIEEAENNRGATLVDAVVDRLLERMTSLKEEASKIISDEERSSDSTCLMGLHPNLWACYLTSKSARKVIDEAVELLEEEKRFDRPVASVNYSECLGVAPIVDFEEFESRVLVSNQIVAALKDPNANKVGVYGMGGTGKTTLAEQIGAELQRDGTFSHVVLAIVSEKQSLLQNNYQPDLTSIQKQIAGGLKIQLQGETLNDRATQLREQLQKKDKLLIILDDIWSRFDLVKVGIPVGSRLTVKLKILMTSRSKLVLENEMDSTNNFGLDYLPADDARNLFDKMVGGDSQYSNWPLTAQQVVDQCGGIPILLATTGRALRNVNQSIWEDALTQLRQFDGEDFDEEAYKRIEVSYKFLKNEEIKKLFLLCAQLDHRSIGFEELLRYTMGLDLFKGRKKVKEVSGRLHKYLRDLKGCCLLQDGNKEGVIKMHDVVYKFATFVASRDHDVFTVANDGELEEWPSKDQFEKFTAISLFCCRLPSNHELPVSPNNPKLESFLMLRSEIDASFKIQDDFFTGMKGLKLMNLTKMSLSLLLVSSLSSLVKLRTLCLDHCELGDIAVIGELPMLQALSLTGSSIVWVPKEIGNLGNTLKLLDLLGCLQLTSIASGVISRLTLLEELRIGDSFMNWQRLEGSEKRGSSADVVYEADVASLDEFKNLQNLINLEIRIPDHAKMFPKDLVLKKLETFRIFIGNRGRLNNDCILTRTLDVIETSTVVEFDCEGTKALITRAESLLLEGLRSSVSVSEIDMKGFPELKHLQVFSTRSIQYIVKKNYNSCIFSKLETLKLDDLPGLERVCDDDHDLPVGSFGNLGAINVWKCMLLNELFSSSLAKGLLRLREIRVTECRSMETIIASREGENEEEINMGFSHQLRVLELHELPRLVSFYRFKQLKGLPSPTSFFNKEIVFPKLEVLTLSRMKIEKIWDDHLETCWFQNLTSLKVSGCDKLRYLFTFSMVKSLIKLKELRVDSCKSIEEIVATKKGEMEGERLLLFPELEYLELETLLNLRRFSHANLLECPSLQKLKIRRSPLLKAFISTTSDSTLDLEAHSTTLFDEKVVFPKLEASILIDIRVDKIWNDEKAMLVERSCWLQNLKSLDVYACGNLLSLAPPSTTLFKNLTGLLVWNCPKLIKLVASSTIAKSLVNLKEMSVSRCHSLEEIVTIDDRWGNSSMDEYVVFDKLELLKLGYLNNLTSFCSTTHCNFRFPALNRVIVANCPKMKVFSKGGLSTPKLTRMLPFWAEEEDEEKEKNQGQWEGDLNSTIQQLLGEMACIH